MSEEFSGEIVTSQPSGRYMDKLSIGYIVVAFGDIPAAVFLEICFRMTITMFGHVDLMAAFRLHEDHYVDDITTGGTEAEL